MPTVSPRGVTAGAHPNLALVKYWGQVDEALNLPANGSISVNLSGAQTVTTVAFDAALEADAVTINGERATPRAAARVSAHLDRVRALAGLAAAARVTSHNDFPADSGIASSASAFAALSLAASRAAGLRLSERELSALARRGSGSACRSVPDGFVEWVAEPEDAGSYAHSLAPCDHWDLRVVTVHFGEHAKAVSSLAGHRAAPSSPFYRARLAAMPATLRAVREALLAHDFPALGMAVEREAVAFHAVAMTSTAVAGRPWLSGIHYWLPETLALMRAAQRWRREGLGVYFTLDAGPSTHLLCERATLPALEAALDPLLASLGGQRLVSEPGRGAWLLDEHGNPTPPQDPTCER